MSSTKNRYQAFLDFVDWCHRRGYSVTDLSEGTELDKRDAKHVERAQFTYEGRLYVLTIGWYTEIKSGRLLQHSLYGELATIIQYACTDCVLCAPVLDSALEHGCDDSFCCDVDLVENLGNIYQLRAALGLDLTQNTVDEQWADEDIEEYVELLHTQVSQITPALDSYFDNC